VQRGGSLGGESALATRGKSETALEQSWLLVNFTSVPTVPGRAGPSVHSLGQLGQPAPGPWWRELPKSIQEACVEERSWRNAAEKVSGSFGARQPQACLRLIEGVWFVSG